MTTYSNDEKATIAFMASSLVPGGAERVITELANAYLSQYKVIIITFQKSKSYFMINENIEVYPCVEQIMPSANIFHAVSNNLTLYRRMVSILREHKVKFCISFLTTVNVISILAARKCKIPVIISERNNPIVVPPNLFWRLLRNIIYPYCDYLVVQSEGSKNFFKKIVPENKIKIIINPMSDSSKISGSNMLVKEDDDNINILSVGRLTENKATHIAILALANLKKYKWKMNIAGDGEQKEYLIELTSSLKLDNRINFVGNVKNISDLYQKSDIFLFTSRSEGFPNALIEAYYNGLACISTDCDFGPRDIITDGKDGFLIPVNDVEQLSSKLEKIFNSPEIRSDFLFESSKSRNRFELSNIIAQWKKLSNSLHT